MVDLSRQGAGSRVKDEEPIGLVILGCMPFALLLTAVLLAV